jgi:hypothetical protein
LLVAVHTRSLATLTCVQARDGSGRPLPARLWLSPLPLVITRYLIRVALRAPASIQIYYLKRRLAGKFTCIVSLIIIVCTALNSTEIVSIILETALNTCALLVPKLQFLLL